ncbi:hypothetical protein [Paractinoplanes lichenicola]|uniref:Uncharacterized protein n=1 Tax=Paractinoplanes lichenicola TaxID=2802976 RepID=A0ABS1VMD9_9ACTN|nr:hypothetical protein [Actinoplanes lichenicola]MBL7255894.1 hypothetical protein [Actinoplanes lichenicola]
MALLATWRQPYRALVGVATAAFFVAILPGNIAQLTEHRDAFGLNTDTARAIRLLFQPVLVLWALIATNAIPARVSVRSLTQRRHARPGLRTMTACPVKQTRQVQPVST